MKNSRQLSLAAVFAALHVALYLLSFGLWRNWAVYIAPLEGIILGPQIGFIAALLGSSIARLIRPDALWIFGIVAEPLSVLMVGLLARARWKFVLVIYAVLLSAYFFHPFGQILPLWTILDILVAFVLIYPAARLAKHIITDNSKRVFLTVALLAFVCSATDSLIRVFLLVPAGLYSLFFNSYESLLMVFVGSAVSSYVEDVFVVFFSLVITVPVLLRSSVLRLFTDVPSKNRRSLNDGESLGNS
jgi:hypothetical protein